MRKSLVVITLLFSILLPNLAKCQELDSLSLKDYHSPSRAAIYSTILPGLGQAYNKKYWKIPVIYAGAGVIVYFAVTNNHDYSNYRKAFDYKTGSLIDPSQEIIDIANKYSKEDLATLRDYYRRNFELSLIVAGLWYAINILDANVDAHFMHYDINDDLSLDWQPVVQPLQTYDGTKLHTGVSLKLNIH